MSAFSSVRYLVYFPQIVLRDVDKFSINLQKWKEETESRSIVSFRLICSVSLLALFYFQVHGEVSSAFLGL